MNKMEVIFSLKNECKLLVFVAIFFLLSIVLVACSSDASTIESNNTTPTIDSADQLTESSTTPTIQTSPTQTPTLKPIGLLTFGNNANVRSGPGLSFQVTSVVKRGDTLPIYGKSEDEQWYWVDPLEPVWVNVSVATADVLLAEIPLGPTLAPTATKTLIPSPTLRPSPTPIPAIGLPTIYINFGTMTELQFKEYKAKIAGKPVRETVKVGNVSDRGVVSLSGPWSPYLINWSDFCVVLTGMPKEKLLTLDGGDEIMIEATINGIVGNNNYYINCENTLVLNFVK